MGEFSSTELRSRLLVGVKPLCSFVWTVEFRAPGRVPKLKPLLQRGSDFGLINQ